MSTRSPLARWFYLAPLVAACGSDPTLVPVGSGPSTTNRNQLEAHCYYGETTRGRVPLSRIVHAFTTTELGDRLDVAISFHREFVDLSYGPTAVGWAESKKGRHSFKDLVGSDHTELALYDANDTLVLQAKLDFLSESEAAPSGYASLGPTGGDGEMLVGDMNDILGFDSSLDDNLNERGLLLLEASPETTINYEANVDYPDWDFFVEYRLSVALGAFDAAGFGRAHMEMVHASPSKLGQNTVTVTEEGCPDPGSESDPFPRCDEGQCLDPPSEGCKDGCEPSF